MAVMHVTPGPKQHVALSSIPHADYIAYDDGPYRERPVEYDSLLYIERHTSRSSTSPASLKDKPANYILRLTHPLAIARVLSHIVVILLNDFNDANEGSCFYRPGQG